jgi:uncharacterized membrane protein
MVITLAHKPLGSASVNNATQTQPMHLTNRRLHGGLTLMALALTFLTALETQAQYQIATFDVPGYFGFPAGINNNGTIALNSWFFIGPNGPSGGPVLVKGDSATPVSVPNLRYLSMEGINAHETIVGTAYPEDSFELLGVVRTKQGEVTILNIPGASVMPMGINNRGVVVGSVTAEKGTHGFIWDASGPTLFDAPGADVTYLRGINTSGIVVGNYVKAGTSRAFSLEGSKVSLLNLPGATSSFASGINSRGEIAGSYSSAAEPNLNVGFVYDRGIVMPVPSIISEEDAPPTLPSEPFDFGDGVSGFINWVRMQRFTVVYGINDRGDIVGGSTVEYVATIDCDGCGLNPEDFGGYVFIGTFTGERDGSRSVHMKSAGKPQKIRLPRGAKH